jgi:hypothetical protein
MHGHRWFVAALLAPAILATPASALAAQRSGTDHLAAVRFTLHGRLLKAEIAGGGEPTDYAERALKGRLIRATCGTTMTGGSPSGPSMDGSTARAGAPPTPPSFPFPRPSLADRSTFTRVIKRWPAHLQRTTFRLPRDLSANARWCTLERAGHGNEIARHAEIAFVDLQRGHNPAEDVAESAG